MMPKASPVDSNTLVDLVGAEMPFGQFKGWRLLDVPEGYLVWLQNKGWPRGKLGKQLALALEIKHNGLAELARQAARNAQR